MSLRELTPRGEAALKVSEGSIEYVYDDAVFPTRMWKPTEPVRGYLTAGVGHLLKPAEIKQWAGKIIPQSVRDKWQDDDTDDAEGDVQRLVAVPLNDNQNDALILFRYNVGEGGFAGSTLLKKLNAGDYDAVPTELKKWVKTKINGKRVTSKGLIKRRNDEINMWLGGAVPAARNDNMPSGTQIAEAQNQPLTPTEIIGGAGTIISGASGFAYSTGFLSVAFGIAVIIAVLVIGAIVIKRYVLDNPQTLPEQIIPNLPVARPRRTTAKRTSTRAKAPVKAKPVAPTPVRAKTPAKKRAVK